MQRKTDISVIFDQEGEAYFSIPVDHSDEDDPLIKTIEEKGYWPSEKRDEFNSLKSLFFDTTRLKKSSILFNNASAVKCVPNPKAKHPEEEYQKCLLEFDFFLSEQLRSGIRKILECYEQGLINLPGNILFQAFARDGHTLLEKSFQANIDSSGNVLSITSQIQNLKYLPKGKDPENKDDIVELPGYLKSRLEFFETEKERGFNVVIETKCPTILALILGELNNERYIQFLEHYLRVKKNAYTLSKEMDAWIYKTQNTIVKLYGEIEKELDKSQGDKLEILEAKLDTLKANILEIEELFANIALLHARLDLLLASQERTQMSSKKIEKDIKELNLCEHRLDQIAKIFRSKEIKTSALIQQRSEWFSKIKSSIGVLMEEEVGPSYMHQYPDLNNFPW